MDKDLKIARLNSQKDIATTALKTARELLEIAAKNPAILLVAAFVVTNELSKRGTITGQQAVIIQTAIATPAFLSAINPALETALGLLAKLK